MRSIALPALVSMATGYVFAHFLVLFYTHWYFTEHFWLKTLLLTPLLGVAYLPLLFSRRRRFWKVMAAYWVVSHLVWLIIAKGSSLAELRFVNVLDYEVAVVWVPLLVVVVVLTREQLLKRKAERTKLQQVSRELKLRRRLRESGPVQVNGAPADGQGG